MRATTEQADQDRTGLQLLAVLLPVAGGAAYTRVLAPSLPGVAVLGLPVPPARMISNDIRGATELQLQPPAAAIVYMSQRSRPIQH